MSTDLPFDTPHGRRFQLHERIGSGAFGEVYLATQLSSAGFERKVAVKVLHTDRTREDDATRRIRDEARVLGRLHHPNIVTVLDLVRLDTQWAVVMEYVEGADLERVLQALAKAGRVFPAVAAFDLMAAVADALDAAWSAEGEEGRPLRVVHRDIKPANLRVTPNGEVKILDFGIARAHQQREAETGAYVIGTQRYMAPERIAGRADGPEADVYSLAATIYELLTGQPLGRTPVLTDRHDAWVRDRLAGVDRAMRGEPQAVRRAGGLLAQCLSAEPLNRPTAADVAEQAAKIARQLAGEDLKAFGRRFVPQADALLGRRPDVVSGVLTEATTSRVRLDEEPAGTLRQNRRDREDDERPRRGSWLLPALGAASAVVLLGGALLVVAVALGGAGAWWAMRTRAPASIEAAAQPTRDEATSEAEPRGGVTEPSVAEPPVGEPRVGGDPATTRAGASRAAPSEAKPAADAGSKRGAPKPAAEPEAEPVARTISRAQFVVAGAEGLEVQCGTVRATGTASARVMGFPAGECVVTALLGGAPVSGPAAVTAPRTVHCRADGGSLACD